MPDPIVLSVVGVPAPQGSKSAYIRGGRPVMVDGTSKTARAGHQAWRQAVATAARDWLAEHPQAALDEPLAITVAFRFALTADRYRTRHSTKPDLDKLVRSTLDAITSAGLVVDDSRFYAITATKRYAHDLPPGADLTILPAGHAEASDREALKAAAAANRKQARLERTS